jgi:hypothetical protein
LPKTLSAAALRRERGTKAALSMSVAAREFLAIDDANTSYSRLTIMYYRRAQPTTRGLENGYEESDDEDFSGFVEASSGEEGCSEKGAGEEGCGEEARQEGSEEKVDFALSVATGDATLDPAVRSVVGQHRAPPQASPGRPVQNPRR